MNVDQTSDAAVRGAEPVRAIALQLQFPPEWKQLALPITSSRLIPEVASSS